MTLLIDIGVAVLVFALLWTNAVQRQHIRSLSMTATDLTDRVSELETKLRSNGHAKPIDKGELRPLN